MSRVEINYLTQKFCLTQEKVHQWIDAQQVTPQHKDFLKPGLQASQQCQPNDSPKEKTHMQAEHNTTPGPWCPVEGLGGLCT